MLKPEDSQSIEYIIAKFEDYVAGEKRFSAGTVKNYLSDVREFVAFTTNADNAFEVGLVTHDDIKEWIISLSENKLKPASVNKKISSVRAFFHFCHSRGLIETNPALTVSNMKTPRPLPVYIHEDRMQHITQAIIEMEQTDDFEKCRDALIILMFYCSGMRLAELIALDIDDFSDDMHYMRIHGKGDKEREVPIVGLLAKNIKIYTKIRRNICIIDKKALFLTLKGERMTRRTVGLVVKHMLQEMGVQGKCSPHVLRHTFATHLLNNGADIREIQELLGHASLSTTQIYTHNSISQLKAVYNIAHPRAQHKYLKED